MKNVKGLIFNIERGSFVDGPGIRTVVFLKGCNLRCKWCHNPESLSFAPQMTFYREKCVGCGVCKEVCPNGLEKCDLCGKCARFCPQNARKICGKEYAVEEVVCEIKKDETFFETSGGGVTFSGGECMLQIEFLTELLKSCKQEGIPTAVDTAGCVPWERFEAVLPYTDLFLYDIKCMTASLHEEWTGKDNRLILENLAKLLRRCPDKISIRIPLVKGVNDTDGEIGRILAFFSKHGSPKDVKLLPYHAFGLAKGEAVGKSMERYAPPSAERLQTIVKLFENTGIKTEL